MHDGFIDPKKISSRIDNPKQWRIKRSNYAKKVSIVADGANIVVKAPLKMRHCSIVKILKNNIKTVKTFLKRCKKFLNIDRNLVILNPINCLGFTVNVLDAKGRDVLDLKNKNAVIYIDSSNKDLTRKKILHTLLEIGKVTLLPRLEFLSKKHNLTYQVGRIKNVKTIWGSCSGKNNITLSSKLVLLNQRFADYVILHELAHIKHKNHSRRFWDFLDKLTNEDAKKLSSELRKENYPFKFSLFH